MRYRDLSIIISKWCMDHLIYEINQNISNLKQIHNKNIEYFHALNFWARKKLFRIKSPKSVILRTAIFRNVAVNNSNVSAPPSLCSQFWRQDSYFWEQFLTWTTFLSPSIWETWTSWQIGNTQVKYNNRMRWQDMRVFSWHSIYNLNLP